MTISGGIKFFEQFKTLASAGNSATASSGDPAADFALDRNDFTCWRSSGSNDLTTETWEFTFAEPTVIDRLFILDHNFKEFTVEYDSAGWIDFTNVIGLDGALVSGISETNFVDDTAYYEFTSVSTTKIRIQIASTQVVDEEKFMTTFTATVEIGTLEGFPNITSASKSKNLRRKETLNGRVFVQKSLEVKKYSINFKDYPADLPNDINLIISLFDSDNSALVWLCGGRRGTPYFKFTLVGFRLKDLIQMQVTNKYNDSYRNNFYNGVVKMKMRLEESV